MGKYIDRDMTVIIEKLFNKKGDTSVTVYNDYNCITALVKPKSWFRKARVLRLVSARGLNYSFAKDYLLAKYNENVWKEV
jgi:hypothetical protein